MNNLIYLKLKTLMYSLWCDKYSQKLISWIYLFIGKRRAGRWHQRNTFFREQLWQWSRDQVDQKERIKLKKEKKEYYARKHRTSHQHRFYDKNHDQDEQENQNKVDDDQNMQENWTVIELISKNILYWNSRILLIIIYNVFHRFLSQIFLWAK